MQVAALWLLRDGAGIGLSLATALAVETALLHNFAWHECWTWNDRRTSWADRLGRLKFPDAGGGPLIVAKGVVASYVALND